MVVVLITVTVPKPAPLVLHRYGEVNRAILASLTAMVMALPVSDRPVASTSEPVPETDKLNPDAPLIYFKDLMAKIGYFLFYWASLEQELIQGIISARESAGMDAGNIPASMADRLIAWKAAVCAQPGGSQYAEVTDQVQRQTLVLRDIRNHIVHGIRGDISQAPDGIYIICSIGKSDKLHTETVTYRYADLEHYTQGIDACRRAFIHPQNFNYSIDFRETSAG